MKNHESMYTDMRFQFSDSNLRCKKSASRVFLLGISEVFEKFHGDSSWGTSSPGGGFSRAPKAKNIRRRRVGKL